MQSFPELLQHCEEGYVKKPHPPAYSAQRIASQAHICGRQVAKSVVVKLDGRLALFILPATERVNFGQLRQVTGCYQAELADEWDYESWFSTCEGGVIPAFGNCFGLPVYVSETLKGDEPLAFSGNKASERVMLSWQAFNHLVQPTVVSNQLRDAIG